MKRTVSRAVLLVCAAGGSTMLSACDDPLTDPALIAGPRIVGARVSAEDDVGRAEPAPGGAASIDWLVVSDQPGPFSARVVWCVAAPSGLGAPRCEPNVFADESSRGDFGTPLRLSFEVPSELAPGSAWLAWLGICTVGEPVFDVAASVFRCDGGGSLFAFYRGQVPEGSPNRNPSLADDDIALAGEPWLASALAPEGSAPGSACRQLGVPLLPVSLPASLSFELGGDDREPLENRPGTYGAHERESLVYTHLSSHPGLERAFSAIDYDADVLGFEVPFDFGGVAPGADGELASFYLLVRDERGGVDWLRRDTCLISP
jgi:hypothetical protein